MRRINRILYMSITALAVCLSQQLSAITVQELHELMESGEKLTIIDIRNLHAYKNNHIPGSINIPAQLMANKKLPPLGQVVVYGDGIHTQMTDDAAISLNQKNGIQADVLEGGITTWQSFNMPDTQAAGMKKSLYRYITYQDLLELVTENTDIVLVDLRQAKAEQILTDLSEQFAGVEVIKPSYRADPKNNKRVKMNMRSLMSRRKGQVPPVFILIDNGGQRAEKAYRRLGAGRIKRLAILVGGELILSRQGQSGQQQSTISTRGEVQ